MCILIYNGKEGINIDEVRALCMDLDIEILDFEPYSKARKHKDPRDTVLWNMCYGLIRKVQNIKAATISSVVGLEAVARQLGVPYKSLERYFWGLKDKNQGPPITTSKVKNFEKLIPTMLAAYSNMVSGEAMAGTASHTCQSSPKQDGHVYVIRTERGPGAFIVDRLGDKTAFTGAPAHPEAWILRSQRMKGGVKGAAHIYPGFRGRFVGRTGKLSGKCFEFLVVTDTGITRPAGCEHHFYTPKFIVRLVDRDESGFAVSNSMSSEGSTPQSAWKGLFENLNVDDYKAAFTMCGFHDAGLQSLLAPSEHVDTLVFGERIRIGSMSTRWIRKLVARAHAQVKSAMRQICPSDPIRAFHLLRNSAAFQAEFWPHEEQGDLACMPFLAGMANSYADAPTCETKLGTLSLVAPFFKHDIVINLFKI